MAKKAAGKTDKKTGGHHTAQATAHAKKSLHAKKSVNKPVKKPVKKKHIHNAIHKKAAPKRYGAKFCPKCGKPLPDGKTLCKDCHTVDFDFKDIKLLVCNNCQSYNHKNKWQRFHNLDVVLKTIVAECVKHHILYEDLDPEAAAELLSFKAGVHRDFTINVNIAKEHFDLPATLDVTLCPKCSKRGTKYFEGVLQVRNATAEMIEFIKNDLHKNRSKGVHVNKEVDIDGTGSNIDYYYTDKGYLKAIAEKLRKNFGARLKQNAQLFSIDWETSKNLYRLNVLADFPNYHKNDVIKIGKQLYKIVSMDDKIHVVNIESNSKTLLPHKESYDVLKPVEVMLIKKYPEYEVLDPNTYYQARLMNPSEALQINQKIHVVIDGGEAWMVKE